MILQQIKGLLFLYLISTIANTIYYLFNDINKFP